MALVALDGNPIVAIGQPLLQNGLSLSQVQSVVIDAANEALHMVGHIITDDGGSHTINTSGSSSIGWRVGAVTFANAGTTLKVGLAAVDMVTGPPPRATNVADVVTFSVSRSLTGGGGGVTANSYLSHVPDTGSMTIANGDFIAACVQMTARGGSDLVNVSSAAITLGPVRPANVAFIGGVYTLSAAVPNILITFSDGHLGWFYGGSVFSTPAAVQSWNNASASKEYGNYFQLPFPMRIYGLYAVCDIAGNTDLVLYSDPLGTPVSERSISVDVNTAGIVDRRYAHYLFASPYTTTANQSLAAVMKPTSGTTISSSFKTFSVAAHQITEMCGTNGYAVNRNTGAFAAQNSGRDRFGMGLLVGAFDAGGVSTRDNMFLVT